MASLQDPESLAVQYNLAAAYNTHRPSLTPSPGLTSLIDKATKDGGHIFFGEPHADGMIVKQYEMLANNLDAFKVAAANGIKNLALELPSAMQSKVDDFVSGKISKQNFRIHMGQFEPTYAEGDAAAKLRDHITQTVENAKSAGMKVHFADMTSVNTDTLYKALYPPSVHKLDKNLKAAYDRDKPEMPYEEYAKKEVAKMTGAEKIQLKKDIQDHQLQWRANRYDDTEQYRYLRDRIPMGEGIMGVVGNRHLDNGLDTKVGRKIMGVDDYLEAEGHRVTTVDVHTTKTKAYQEAQNKLEGTQAADPPDYKINMDDRSIQDRSGQRIGTLDSLLTEPPQQPPKLRPISEVSSPVPVS